MKKIFSSKGFTLIEILIALFIFAIISTILATTLHTIFSNQTRAEQHAEKLNELQLAILLFSRDIQQVVDRPITDTQGAEQTSFIGTSSSVTFTHGGWTNPLGALNRSTLQRVNYFLNQHNLFRQTWDGLDITSKNISSSRKIFSPVQELQFDYFDEKNQLYNRWPPPDKNNAGLPRAVRIIITIPNQGKLSQLYIITGKNLAT